MATSTRPGEFEVTPRQQLARGRFVATLSSTMIALAKPTVVVRAATLADVPHLVVMNHAAYPELVEENVVWNEGQLRSHIARFPQGQLVADVNGVPMGAISTFIVSRARDPLDAHTWLGITEDGTFAGHDPGGDTLYLADIYVDPTAWGKGVSQTLYAALCDLCVRLGLRRVVAGGRLWGYHEHAATLTPQEYIARVLRGELRDRVLGSQINAGFVVRGVLVGYLRDPRSQDFATLLEWMPPSQATGEISPRPT
ncbi:MAG: GNAT family N-acetyltransferase [Myxococcota bacterium]|nr:GNAT family N-acetyltransferase [Myxococcota bacterium]